MHISDCSRKAEDLLNIATLKFDKAIGETNILRIQRHLP
jgi:hypothetical protein